MTVLPVLDPVSGWRLAPDVPPPMGWWLQPLMKAALVDEITGQPPTSAPIAATTTPNLVALARETEAFLVGQPLRLFLPDNISGASLNLSLSGGGYLPVAMNGTFGAEFGYPGVFAPIDLGTLTLHREPVAIGGRTVSKGGAIRAGASVSLDGVWFTLADLANPPAAANLVSLSSPLYADRDSTATVAAQPMTPNLAQQKTLMGPANVGDGAAVLSDQLGLAVGGVVAIDSQDPARAEYLAVTAIASLGPGPGFPATVTFAFPLIRPHASGASAVPMNPGVAGAANGLSTASRSGDVTLLPATSTGLSAPATPVVVVGSGAPAEYHLASPIGGVSGSDGYVALPPVHRVAQLRLRVHHPAEPTDLISDVMLPLGVTALTVDFVFP